MWVSPLTDHFTLQLIQPKTSTFQRTRVTLRPAARQIPITKCECSFNATTSGHDPSSAHRTMISTLISLHCQNSITSQTTVAQHIESTGNCIVCRTYCPISRQENDRARLHNTQTQLSNTHRNEMLDVLPGELWTTWRTKHAFFQRWWPLVECCAVTLPI